jgi:hypothetical protein
VSVKFNVNSPLTQLFELLNTTPPFDTLAVISDAEPPTGVTTASTIPFIPTASGLGFVTENFSTGTLPASGSWVESGGVPDTVATASTGGVDVEVGVLVKVCVKVFVKVGVKVNVKVSVGVKLFVKVGVKVFVKVGVSVDVFVKVKVGVKVAVAVATVTTAPPTGTPVTCAGWPDTLSTACKDCKVVE